jgi:predicted small metal-binding protein
MFADKTVRCDCGYEVRAPDEDDLVDEIRRHAWEAHEIDFSAELALELARQAELASSERDRIVLEASAVNRKGNQ